MSQKLLSAIRDPQLAKKVLKDEIKRYSSIPANKKKGFEQRKKNSRYGLVLNWGLHLMDDWMVAESPFFVRKFIEKFDPLIITSQDVYDHHAEKLDNIFAFGARNNKGPTLNYREDQTVLLFASDPNNRPGWLHEYAKSNEIDYVLTPYYHPFLYYLPDFDESKLVHFPWAVPDEFVIDTDSIEYHHDPYVSITGAGGAEIYETRDWCRSQPGVKSFRTSGHKNKVFSHQEYYLWLRQFDAMIAAGSDKEQWQYTFAKYYEIPAAGALLFAQYTKDLERAGFSDRNCLIFESKEEFREKKDQYLDAPEEYLEKRAQGVELIDSRHTIEDRLEIIEDLFE